jgi:hypothetical protein
MQKKRIHMAQPGVILFSRFSPYQSLTISVSLSVLFVSIAVSMPKMRVSNTPQSISFFTGAKKYSKPLK